MTRVKKIDNRKLAIPPTANGLDNTGGMIEGLTEGVTYGTGEKIQNQAAQFGMPKTQSIPQPQINMPQVDAFGNTNQPEEFVTAGMSGGPGPGPETGGPENINDFIYQSWIESGDDSLLQYII